MGKLEEGHCVSQGVPPPSPSTLRRPNAEGLQPACVVDFYSFTKAKTLFIPDLAHPVSVAEGIGTVQGHWSTKYFIAFP
uniref:Uncharacterized protein n=1 Tax=Ascaris lumbricoides TaxID=6252 RepID=A0A0M3HS65_ASCLU